MSLQRIAIISAVSSHGMMRNRTVYYERQQNETNFDRGINLEQHFNVFIGGAFLSFAITLLCAVCYCFNKIINKNSMAVYRRHLMEAANNQNVDIYTVEQFYETEAYAPLCGTQSAQSVLPPSYEDVMAAEKAILSKYAKICTSTKCCEVCSQLNRSNSETPAGGNGDEMNSTESTATSTPTAAVAAAEISADTTATPSPTENCCTQPNANNQETNRNAYDDNDNEVRPQEATSTCCVSHYQNNANTCCCAQKECSCVDNCTEHCMNVESSIVVPDINANTNSETDANANPTIQRDENDNECATSTNQDDSSHNNNNNINAERMNASNKCQCARHHQDSPVEFDVLSDNGIVRMDMSKIIDRTGLPTYDAAIKLESFGYV